MSTELVELNILAWSLIFFSRCIQAEWQFYTYMLHCKGQKLGCFLLPDKSICHFSANLTEMFLRPALPFKLEFAGRSFYFFLNRNKHRCQPVCRSLRSLLFLHAFFGTLSLWALLHNYKIGGDFEHCSFSRFCFFCSQPSRNCHTGVCIFQPCR